MPRKSITPRARKKKPAPAPAPKVFIAEDKAVEEVKVPEGAASKDLTGVLGAGVQQAAKKPIIEETKPPEVEIVTSRGVEHQSLDDILERAREGQAHGPTSSTELKIEQSGGGKSRAAPARKKLSSRVASLIIITVLFISASVIGVYLLGKRIIDRQVLLPPPQPAVVAALESVAVTFTVVVIPEQSANFPALVTRAIETDVSAKQTFPATGSAAKTDGYASGRVKIINEAARNFNFVATTRVLSKENILFRLKKAAFIPANGETEADVIADKPGPGSDIEPTTFTFPGLPPQLRTEVYAVSETLMSGGSGTVKAVTAKDIAAAKEITAKKLQEEAEENFKAMINEGEKLVPDLITSTELSSRVPEEGLTENFFDVNLSLRFHALLVPEKEVLPLLEEELKRRLPSGENFADYELGALFYAVQAYDTITERAEIRAEAAVKKR